MALEVLCILGKEPEWALIAYQSSSFFANRTPERSTRWRDELTPLAPTVPAGRAERQTNTRSQEVEMRRRRS
jgi:hypothetical protein